MPPPHRSKPPHPPLPVGFLLLGMGLLLVGFGCTAVVASGEDVFSNALFGLVALLSLVLVEALWYVRPWVARAADAWAAACVGVVFLPILAVMVVGGMWMAGLVAAMIALTFVALPCAAVRWYVRDRARKLGLAPRTFAPPAAPVAVPRPQP